MRYGLGHSRRPGMDPDTRRLVIFAGSLGAVLLTLIGASFLVGHRSTEVPIVVADSRPVRVKPENPGGMKIDGAENDVFLSATDNKNARLAPAAEAPDIKRLTATPATAPAPDVAAPAAIAPAKPAAISAPAVSAPAAKPLPAKPPLAAVEARPPAAAGHPATVQLAAVTSEDAARNEWQLLARRMPELLNGHQPVFSRIERNGHTFWRVRTAGFADVAQARSFCDRIRAKGAGCTVADF
jgi:hypothetical protein